MKFVLKNCSNEDYTLPEGYVDAYELEDEYDYDDDTIRTDARLIEWMSKSSSNDRYASGDLKLVEIPDTATDFEINIDEDGWEFITYVVNGKLYHA